MLILSVDSTASAASVAVCENEKALSHITINTKLTHSQTLLPMIDEALKNAGHTMDDIDILAVSNGPGSFTGVRIGVSLVKGLAFNRNIKCAGVSTLEALARNIEGFDGIYCPVMDARNNQVYNALFEYENGALKRLTPDRAIAAADLRAELEAMGDRKVWLIGDGANLCSGLFSDMKNVFAVNETVKWQNAISVARCAIAMEKQDLLTEADALDVNYLRLSQAEREYNKKMGQTV